MTEQELHLIYPHLKELTPQEQADKDVEVMGHSVKIINDSIEDCRHTQDEHDTIERNVRHLEIMLAKEHIVNHSSSKTEFKSAIAAGKKHIK